MSDEDPDIELIKARKLKELRQKAAAFEKSKSSTQPNKKSARDVVSHNLYDRGSEVLELAYAQFPAQTEAIITRIAELLLSGEVTGRISGGELLSLFRSVGLNVRVNTTIKVEDKGKLISFSDKLKQQD